MLQGGDENRIGPGLLLDGQGRQRIEAANITNPVLGKSFLKALIIDENFAVRLENVYQLLPNIFERRRRCAEVKDRENGYFKPALSPGGLVIRRVIRPSPGRKADENCQKNKTESNRKAY